MLLLTHIVAVRFKADRDDRVLFELPIEEREVLAPLLGLKPKKGEGENSGVDGGEG